MKTNGGFLVTKIKQLGDRIFERILAEKNIDAFNGAQGRILYVLWQEDGVPIKIDEADKRKTLLFLTDKAKELKEAYDSVSNEMGNIYYRDFTDKEILQFEEYLNRIRVNLEEWSDK